MTHTLNKHSDAWLAVKKYCQSRRDNYVDELIEGSPHDEQIRGRIQFIDELLKLESPENPPPTPTVSYL